MQSKTSNSIQKSARMAGLLYLLLAIFSGFPSAVRSGMIIAGDAAGTVGNIVKSEGLFRFTIVSDQIGQIIHILLVLALFELLKTVDRKQSWLMVCFALVPVPIAMLCLNNLFAALSVLNGSDPAQVLFYLNMNHQGVLIAGIFWGLWLIPLGTLVIKSGFLPKVLGIFLYIAAAGYMFDSFTAFLFPTLGVSVALYTFWGEVFLLLWLLIKGVNVQNWEKQYLQTA